MSMSATGSSKKRKVEKQGKTGLNIDSIKETLWLGKLEMISSLFVLRVQSK